MDIYFSHPTFTFHTETEKKCLRIIREYLEADKITNPADLGLKNDIGEKLEKADSIVAMAVSMRFTYTVWKEMEIKFGEENEEKINEEDKEVRIYTFMVENKNEIGPLIEGIPDGIEKLSKKESKKFSYKITKEDYQDGFMSSLIGSHGSRF